MSWPWSLSGRSRTGFRSRQKPACSLAGCLSGDIRHSGTQIMESKPRRGQVRNLSEAGTQTRSSAIGSGNQRQIMTEVRSLPPILCPNREVYAILGSHSGSAGTVREGVRQREGPRRWLPSKISNRRSAAYYLPCRPGWLIARRRGGVLIRLRSLVE
jgi:hypothetical protein